MWNDYKNESYMLEHNKTYPNVCEGFSVCFFKNALYTNHYNHKIIHKDKTNCNPVKLKCFILHTIISSSNFSSIYNEWAMVDIKHI